MAEKIWKVEKSKYCERVGREVQIEDQVAYPAEILPDQPPRVLARRCSNAIECNLTDKAACSLCGTNPDLDPV